MNPEEAPKTPPEAETPPAHPPAPPDKPKSKSRPVKVYLTVLFCVALLLLLISFVMQQRNHLALQDLNDSISNTQEIADLQLENQRLQYELEDKQALEEPGPGPAKQVRPWSGCGRLRQPPGPPTPGPGSWWRPLRRPAWRAACPPNLWWRGRTPLPIPTVPFTPCCFEREKSNPVGFT